MRGIVGVVGVAIGTGAGAHECLHAIGRTVGEYALGEERRDRLRLVKVG